MASNSHTGTNKYFSHEMPIALLKVAPPLDLNALKERDARVDKKLLESPGLQTEIATRQIAIRKAAQILEPCAFTELSISELSPREFIRDFARSIVYSKDYQDVTKMRAANGTLHPTIEKLLLEYAFGSPTEDAGESSDSARKALESLTSEELQARADMLSRGFEIQAKHERHECGGVPGNCYICKSKPTKFSTVSGDAKNE